MLHIKLKMNEFFEGLDDISEDFSKDLLLNLGSSISGNMHLSSMN